MKLFLTQKSVNYKGIIVLVVLLAAVAAVVIERVLYQLCGETTEQMLSMYTELIFVTAENKRAFFLYLLTNRLKQTFCLIVTAFTVVGFPIHVLVFFQKAYR